MVWSRSRSGSRGQLCLEGYAPGDAELELSWGPAIGQQTWTVL